MTHTSSPHESEQRSSFFSGWRKALIWAAGAAALGIVGYHGTLGTETAAAGPPAIPTTTPATASAPDTDGATTASVATPATSPPSSTTLPTGASAAPDTAGSVVPDGDAPPHDASPPHEAARPLDPTPPDTTAPPDTSARPGGEPGSTTAPSGITADGKVILNLASEAELRKLPGIGKSRARAILEQRQRVGRFRRLEDLLRVKGIGRKRLAALRARLVLDAP